MKTNFKSIIIIGLAIIIISLGTSSCSKSYNCHCTYKTNGNLSHEDDSKISEGSRDKSAAACDQHDNTFTSTLNGNTSVSTTECDLTN